MSPLECTIPNSVKLGVSMGYLPSNCQYFNLKTSGDNSKDQWEHRDILALSSPHAYLPSTAGFSHILFCFHFYICTKQWPSTIWFELTYAEHCKSRWLEWSKAYYNKSMLRAFPATVQSPPPSCPLPPALIQHCRSTAFTHLSASLIPLGEFPLHS